MDSSETNFFRKHEFLIRRLHSLSGLLPVGAYMIVHLLTNASILNGVESFQNLVYQIHSLGKILWIVEWGFIFLPLLFHAGFGVVIIMGSKSNTSQYSYVANWRYRMQRITGMVALLFIGFHVLHMHGWFHVGFWKTFAHAIGMAQFSPYNAASTAGEAMQSTILMPVFYFVGIAACVYHLANGVWTMGITWGVWTTPQAQKRATIACAGLGGFVMIVAISALVGFCTLDTDKAQEREIEMYQESVNVGRIIENEEKLSKPAQKKIKRERRRK